MILIVTYDLHQPGRDYPKIEACLKAVDGSWAHPQGSVWLLDTLLSSSNWVDRLRAVGDMNDEYFVARLYPRTWASFNMNPDVVAWLNDANRRW